MGDEERQKREYSATIDAGHPESIAWERDRLYRELAGMPGLPMETVNERSGGMLVLTVTLYPPDVWLRVMRRRERLIAAALAS